VFCISVQGEYDICFVFPSLQCWQQHIDTSYTQADKSRKNYTIFKEIFQYLPINYIYKPTCMFVGLYVKYREFPSSSYRALQNYYVESLHPPTLRNNRGAQDSNIETLYSTFKLVRSKRENFLIFRNIFWIYFQRKTWHVLIFLSFVGIYVYT
jgi:hypothetical protein